MQDETCNGEVSELLDAYEEVLPGARQRLIAMRQFTSDWHEVGQAVEDAMRDLEWKAA